VRAFAICGALVLVCAVSSMPADSNGRAPFPTTERAFPAQRLPYPAAAIDLWGDSLIDYNHAPGSVSDQLSKRLGGSIVVHNYGVVSQNTDQISLRAGGSPMPVSFAGGEIPAAKVPVAITNFTMILSPVTQGSNPNNGTDPLDGSVGGVRGTLRSVRARPGGPVEGLLFLRDAPGAAVRIKPDTLFEPTAAESTRNNIQVLVWGRNEVGGAGGTGIGNRICDHIDRQVAAMTPREKRFLVGSVLKSNRDAAAAVIDDINAVFRARNPSHYVDLSSPPTAEEMAALAFVPNADDRADMAAGFIPRGMRNGGYSGGPGAVGGDQMHLNATGNDLWALRIERALKQHGWVLPLRR
jgi:hypothetical protein